MSEKKYIKIRGARVHNLKDLSLDIPMNKLVVITGVSGSGKSSLAFDTLFAEGQRRYVESLSSYARQFLGRINKPDVDTVEGIAPAIAVEQKVSGRNPRSTVGTTTEIYDYMKLLFARIGRLYSPVTGEPVERYEVTDVVRKIEERPHRGRITVAAGVVLEPGQSLIEKITLIVGDGYDRMLYNGRVCDIAEVMADIDTLSAEDLAVVVDRMDLADWSDELMARLADSVNIAMSMTYGKVIVADMDANGLVTSSRTYSRAVETQDGVDYIVPNEHLFSFNSPLGACPVCEGYGKTVGIDENLVVPNKNKSVYDNAIACWNGETMKRWKERVIDTAEASGFPIHRPYNRLSDEERAMLWHGCRFFKGIDAFFAMLEKEKYKIQYRALISRYTGKRVCPECGGGRLRKEAGYVRIDGYTITDMAGMSASRLKETMEALNLTPTEHAIAARILTEIKARLSYLEEVGLGYLTIDRLSNTLSGGESQRINLATSLGSALVGSMYILDEPSIGLHPRDTERLIGVLERLRDLGNTVIVVEHDAEIMNAADWIIDIGPDAGIDGGRIVFEGDRTMLASASPESYTAAYLTGRRSIAVRRKPRIWKNYLEIKGVRENNLKDVDVRIPLGVMTAVTGVSGSGKSSLIKGVLYPLLARHFNQTGTIPSTYDSFEGDLKLLSGVEMVDQNPIGRSSRSNPVTYIKAYDEIRKLFSQQQAAKIAGLTPSSFSFNIAGGRCEECGGEGVIKVEMQFMADIEMVCEECGGKRFKDEVLAVRYKDKSIDMILDMSVSEAIAFFGSEKDALCGKIVEKLQALEDVGLGYVRLGQSSSTLSGGESQRVKLASFLLKENSRGPVMFIFDEPTTGLHAHDINKLLKAFDALIERGHTIVVVEHNIDVICSADYIIDLGPEGGDEGGGIVACGTPEEVADSESGYTSRFIADRLKEKR